MVNLLIIVFLAGLSNAVRRSSLRDAGHPRRGRHRPMIDDKFASGDVAYINHDDHILQRSRRQDMNVEVSTTLRTNWNLENVSIGSI